jgi:adenosylcobinamide-GDP ribazoletransferase
MRSAGLGEKMVTNLPKSSAIVISFIGVLAGFYFLEELPIIFMLIMLFIIRYQANKRLSGVTGDVYGAAVELVEASILLGVVL